MLLVFLCQCSCQVGTWLWGGVSGCRGYAVRLCVGETSDGWMVACDLMSVCGRGLIPPSLALASPFHSFVTTMIGEIAWGPG